MAKADTLAHHGVLGYEVGRIDCYETGIVKCGDII